MLTPQEISLLKGKRKLTVLTAYDYPTAKILAEADIDMLLVGDSLGMVVLGYPHTRSVTFQDIFRHTQAVARGNQAAIKLGHKGSLVIVDMPLNTADTAGMAIRNCRFILEHSGAHAVKIEGNPHIAQALVEAHIPVMGHTGLKPQSAQKFGLSGKGADEADLLLQEALALEKAGIFSLVLECIPNQLAQKISGAVQIPTIGIGAGNGCDGQVLVVSDMIGLYDDFKPKFVRRYANVAEVIKEAAVQFKKDTESGSFPNEKESF